MQNFVAIDFETANFKPESVSVGTLLGGSRSSRSVGRTLRVKDGERSPLRRKPLLPFRRENAPRPVPNSRVQHHDRKGRYRSAKSTGDMGFRSPHRFRSAVSAGAQKSADTEVWAEAIDRVKQYFPFIEDGEVPFVAHNKAFDENCLRAVFAAYDTKYPDYEFDCTLLKSRKVWPEGHHNLDIIAGYCGYDLKNHHHALADAEACAVIGIQIL